MNGTNAGHPTAVATAQPANAYVPMDANGNPIAQPAMAQAQPVVAQAQPAQAGAWVPRDANGNPVPNYPQAVPAQ